MSSLRLSLQETDSLKKTQGVGPIRKVVLTKEDHEGLGISITVSSTFDFICRLIHLVSIDESLYVTRSKSWFDVCIGINTGRERARRSHPHLWNPPHPACRALRRTACGRCHLSRQQHQPERCKAQRGRHHPLTAGERHARFSLQPARGLSDQAYRVTYNLILEPCFNPILEDGMPFNWACEV